MKESKINKIEKSWKKDGYVFVGLTGRVDSRLRKVYTYKSKPGIGFINLDTDIFSFNWDGFKGTEIKFVGSYKSVDEAILAIDIKAPAKIAPAVVAVDIDGEIIVGFDKQKIDQILGINS